jgi:hypothetical protein
MDTWMLCCIVIAIALIIYFMFIRKQTIPSPTTPVVVSLPSAPGITPSSGQVPTPPPPPPPPNVSAVARVRSVVAPSNQLQHIPFIGNAAATLVRSPANIGFKVTDAVNNSIEHIPVAGKALAMPGKAITSIAKSLTSWL